MLYAYLSSIGFEESEMACAGFSEDRVGQVCREKDCADNAPTDVLRKECKRRRIDYNVVETRSKDVIESNMHQIVCVSNYKAKYRKKSEENCSLPLISATQYASRSAMLSSLLVAWSPVLHSASEPELISSSNSPNGCSILAVGGKSGTISFWRVYEPQSYSIMRCRDPTSALLIGLLKAHSSWITAINWEISVSDASNPQLLLATGSSDGSVKIWKGSVGELLKSSEIMHASFSLVTEVVAVNPVPVSVLSLILPVRSLPEMLLAIGKGSGSFELWAYDLSTKKCEKAGSYDAHEHIVTGLTWAYNGCCLYSCSQDNSVRSWVLRGNILHELPIPSNTPGVRSSSDVPNAFDSCFGLAVSPGNLVLAVARSFDADLLNPMYQARAQKAAVEFLWIGGQQLDISSSRYPDFDVEAFPGFPLQELVSWEHNILWSLKQFEHLDKPLVVWDIVSALLAFKQSAAKYVEHILDKWLQSCMESHCGISTALLSHAPVILSSVSTRQLHLLNIICRRVSLTELKADEIDSKEQDLNRLDGNEEEKVDLWMELLLGSERELRERLLGLNLAAILNLISQSSTNSCQPGYWHPVGLAQMEQWIALNHDHVKDSLKLLASEVGKLEKSQLQSACGYVVEEQCGYCTALVPFESTEAAYCQGVKCDQSDDGIVRSHKLVRCAVSMQVSVTSPSWFCMCCQRMASKLAPWKFFTLASYPPDFKSFIKPSRLEVTSKPLCPFCGILLQRLQPEFLLSSSPA